MEWNKKVEMIKLSNSDDAEFKKFIMENISNFDNQAWDMFISITKIIESEIRESLEYWKEIFPYIKKLDCNNPAFGMRVAMRISLLKSTLEEVFA